MQKCEKIDLGAAPPPHPCSLPWLQKEGGLRGYPGLCSSRALSPPGGFREGLRSRCSSLGLGRAGSGDPPAWTVSGQSLRPSWCSRLSPADRIPARQGTAAAPKPILAGEAGPEGVCRVTAAWSGATADLPVSPETSAASCAGRGRKDAAAPPEKEAGKTSNQMRPKQLSVYKTPSVRIDVSQPSITLITTGKIYRT